MAIWPFAFSLYGHMAMSLYEGGKRLLVKKTQTSQEIQKVTKDFMLQAHLLACRVFIGKGLL